MREAICLRRSQGFGLCASGWASRVPQDPEEIRDRLKIMANSFVVMSLSLSPHKDTRITGLTPQTFKPYIGTVGELEQDSGHWPKILELEREDLRNRSQKRKWVMGRSGLGNGVSWIEIW